jgi:hypothetical protein
VCSPIKSCLNKHSWLLIMPCHQATALLSHNFIPFPYNSVLH